MLDRYEGHGGEEDEEGSRTYPSKTEIGGAWALGEKYPELVRGKSLLFGLVYLPMYAYYDGLTSAQVELLTMDSPMVDYHADKKGKKKKEPRKPTMADAEEAKRKWEEKYKGSTAAVTFDLTKYE